MTFFCLQKGCQTVLGFPKLKKNEKLFSSKWRSECRPSLILCVDLHCMRESGLSDGGPRPKITHRKEKQLRREETHGRWSLDKEYLNL